MRRRDAAVVEQRGVRGEALLPHQLLVVEPALGIAVLRVALGGDRADAPVVGHGAKTRTSAHGVLNPVERLLGAVLNGSLPDAPRPYARRCHARLPTGDHHLLQRGRTEAWSRAGHAHPGGVPAVVPQVPVAGDRAVHRGRRALAAAADGRAAALRQGRRPRDHAALDQRHAVLGRACCCWSP